MVILEDVPNVVGNVLVDQNDANIISRRKVLESLLDLLQLGVLFDH